MGAGRADEPEAPPLCLEVPRRRREGGCCRRLPGRGGRTGLFRARSGRRPRVTPAEGAGAGLSAHRGGRAGDPASCAPACVPPPLPAPVLIPAAGGTPVPEPRSLCSQSVHPGQGERDARVALEGTSLRSAGKEGADAWRGGVEAPRPEARRPRARLATRHPWPASWLGAGCGRAVCLCAPGPSGRLRRSCSGHPGRQVRTLRAPSKHRPLLRHSLPAAARAPVLAIEGRQARPCFARLAPAWARALSRLGLVPMSCALGTTKCFQRPG